MLQVFKSGGVGVMCTKVVVLVVLWNKLCRLPVNIQHLNLSIRVKEQYGVYVMNVLRYTIDPPPPPA